MSKKSEQGQRPVGKVVKGIGSVEILRGKKKERQNSGNFFQVSGTLQQYILITTMVHCFFEKRNKRFDFQARSMYKLGSLISKKGKKYMNLVNCRAAHIYIYPNKYFFLSF